MSPTFAIFPHGVLALQYGNKRLPLQVLQSKFGFYLGTVDEDGPCSRESAGYWRHQEAAALALATGEWTQKESL